MKGLLWVLTLFALAVGASLALHFNDGYVLVVVAPYRVELSLSLAMLIVIGSFAMLYALLRVIALTRALPAKARAFRERRRHARTVEALYAAARLLFEGRYSQALKKAGEAHATGQLPALAAVLAARSAQRLREPDRQQEWLALATRADPRMQAASLMLEAEMHLDLRQYDEALAALKRLQALSGRHIAALRLELRAEQGCGHWDEVLHIARLLEKRAALPPEYAQAIKLKAHQENIRRRRGDLAQLQAYQNALPINERSPRLACDQALALLDLGAHEAAQRHIEAQLDGEWDSRLLALYGRIAGGDLTGRIACADRWLPQHRDDFELLLALGRMCIEQRLWGKAQIGLKCIEGSRWNVFLPVEIRVYGQALVANRALGYGQPVGSEDVRLQEVEFTREPGVAIADPRQLEGKTAARMIAAGQVLRQEFFRTPPAVNAGDSVRVVYTGEGFNISTSGRAIGNAAEGQPVRVQTEAGRIVQGTARAGRIVEMRL